MVSPATPRRVAATTCLLTASLVGCSDGVIPAVPLPVGAEIVAGTGQTGVVGQELTSPIVVRVIGDDGLSFSGSEVSFIPFAGEPPNLTSLSSGTVSAMLTESDAAGIATTQWTLGGAAGAQTLAVILRAIDDTVFVAGRARAAVPVELYVGSGDGQAAPAGTVLSENLEVHLRDSFGNDTPNVDVAWNVIAGGGSIESSTPTDSSGLARAIWRLGQTGPQQATATSGPRTVTFTAQIQ